MRLRFAIALAGLLGCDPGTTLDGGVDAGLDARAPTPRSVSIGDERATLIVETDPLRVRVERADGSVAVASAGPGLELGTAPRGDERFHDPTMDLPPTVSWRGLELGDTGDASSVRVVDADGRAATVTVSTGALGTYRMTVTVDPAVDDVALLRLSLGADATGTYQGLGERFYDTDARGWIVPMQMAIGGRPSGFNEHHVPVPFFASSNGYGVFVASREAGAFDVAATDPTQVRATFEGHELDVYFYVDPDPREVVAAYTRQTGLPILPPRWAFAPMHWRNEWTDRAALEEDAARIRAEGVPCTTLWIDNPWQASYNDFVFDDVRFEDPQGMLDAMRAQGYVPLVWSTPYLDAVDDGAAPTNEAEREFVTARDEGWLVRQGRDASVYVSPASPGAAGGMIDFTSAGASAFWQSRARLAVDMGVRGFKLDYGEDILAELLGARSQFTFSDGRTERALHNVYNTLYHGPYRAALDAGGGDDGGFLLVRASSWGGQSVADIIWPGDLDNDLREAGHDQVGGLPAAISGLVSLAASGFPHFGSDTGGYRGGMPDRESLLRWAEHTAFTPILQLGGAGAHHNPWLYDDEAGAIYRTLARAHMDLVPFFRVHARRAAETGYPPVAHPSMIWPDDDAGFDDPYVYVLGGDVLVAPVYAPGATTRALHLPPGRWVHWFTGASFDGPADVTVDAPLGAPPVFVRVGALLPLAPADLDTLVEVDPPLVGPAQRPFLRAWSFPGAAATVATEEGPTLEVERTATGLRVAVTPASGEVADVRFQIELAHADPAMGTPTAVTADGAPVPASPDADTARAGCDGACWFVEGDVLWLSVRGASATVVTVAE
ncbi:MAG: glycoside hydrolase family 31 protein [Sandaracinaceae bacterium]|nr:glycoside hydrolase family 31 protein [Sandaracinaceae bacterium]